MASASGYNTQVVRISKLRNQPSNVRILAVMVSGLAILGLVDASFWKGLLSPTLAYRPALAFGLTLLFGWRGLVWSQLLFLAAFSFFLGWRGAALIAPMFLLSHVFGLIAARKLAHGEPWLSRERSTLAFLAGAALAPLLPALLQGIVMRVVGTTGPVLLLAVDAWLRGAAAILAIVPAILVYGPGRFKQWAGFPPDQHWDQAITSRDVLELSAEVVLWTLTLWITVQFKAHYSLNVTYLTFLPPLAFTLFRGMRLATLALAANAIVASTLWMLLHWAAAFSVGDLRLLVSTYSMTILVLAAVVDERKRRGKQVLQLLTQESVLRESEKHFRLLANSAPVMIWVVGPDKLCTFVNKPWLDFTGGTIDQQLGYGWADGIHPDDRDSCLSAFGSAFDARRRHWMECRFRRADGEYRWVLDNGVPLYRDGQFAGFIGTCVDITEQRLDVERLRASEAQQVEARNRLEESQQRLKSAQDLAHVGSWYWDLEADRVFCSDECKRLFGHPEDYQASLEGLIALIEPRDRERVDREIRSSLARASGCSTEFQIVRPDGELRNITFASRILMNSEGLPRHVFGACQDVTDMRRAQEEVFAKQKLETLGGLANGIAHDVNNLLGGVVAQAELALYELQSGSSPIEEITSIREVAMRGSEIVRELMIYAGTDTQQLAPLDLSTVVEEMLGFLKVSVSKRVVIETELAVDLPQVSANSARITQLLMNLVANAAEAIGDREGFIRITTQRIAATAAMAGGNPSTQGDVVQLEVSDGGRGMPLEIQARAFEPFFTTKARGRGLGLAVVGGIVRSLDGAVRVESAPQKGTSIRVTLPSFVEAGGSPSALVDAERTARSVLIVEDEDPLRRAVSKMLNKAGFPVIEAADGTAALRLIRDRHLTIDVLILDISIPGAPSSEIFREASRSRPELPIIVTSAYAKDVAAASLQAEVPQFLRKPYRLDDLLSLIRLAR
jgi:PAS domain S-box-containing protein